MKDNKEFIKGIYEKYEKEKHNIQNTVLKENNQEDSNYKQIKEQLNRQKSTTNNRFTRLKIVSVVAMITIIFSIIMMYQNYNYEEKISSQNNQVNNEYEEKEISLATIDSFENFCNIIKNSNLDLSESDRKSTNESISMTEDISDATYNNTNSSNNGDESNKSEEYSTTNTQVEGVDEADIVKTDGNYIYYITNRKLVIVDIKEPTKMNVIGKIDFEGTDIYPSEIYINKNKLIILGNINKMYTMTKTIDTFEDMTYIAPNYEDKSIAIIYDITKKEEPKEERRIEIKGYYMSSRMIGDNVYFVNNYYLRNISALARNPIEELKEEDYMMSYIDTKISEEEKIIDFNRIHYFDNIEESNYLTIVGFNLNNSEEIDIQTFLGAGEKVYCSTKNMYIQKTKYTYDLDKTERITNANNSTKILKFGLNNGKIKFRAEAEIPGTINNQFSMDENKDGYFRIATTINENWTTNDNTSNNLYILDENLNMTGKIEGLAKGESIYSVRYMEDKAYIVTFKQVDPLFVIDLSDNTNPQVLGELKIPGYSTYLHPYDETHIIGFGYNTREDGTRITNEGLKMAMFDISDLKNPQELYKVDIGNSYTSSDLTYNHKTLLYSKSKNIIGFPIMQYGKNQESKARIYEINLEEGFILKGEISHGGNYNHKIERIIFSGDNYYTLSNKIIKATNMHTLKNVGEIGL